MNSASEKETAKHYSFSKCKFPFYSWLTGTKAREGGEGNAKETPMRRMTVTSSLNDISTREGVTPPAANPFWIDISRRHEWIFLHSDTFFMGEKLTKSVNRRRRHNRPS